MPRSAGDANDDGQFDSSDMMLVLAAGKFETGQAARWEEGDWDGDGLFTFDDVLAALATGTFETGAAVVPRNLAMAIRAQQLTRGSSGAESPPSGLAPPDGITPSRAAHFARVGGDPLGESHGFGLR